MFELLAAAAAVGGIAKHLLASWLGEVMPAAIGGELISTIAGKLGAGRHAAKGSRQIKNIRDAAIAYCRRENLTFQTVKPYQRVVRSNAYAENFVRRG